MVAGKVSSYLKGGRGESGRGGTQFYACDISLKKIFRNTMNVETVTSNNQEPLLDKLIKTRGGEATR